MKIDVNLPCVFEVSDYHYTDYLAEDMQGIIPGFRGVEISDEWFAGAFPDREPEDWPQGCYGLFYLKGYKPKKAQIIEMLREAG